jgi:hypothetical protein
LNLAKYTVNRILLQEWETPYLPTFLGVSPWTTKWLDKVSEPTGLDTCTLLVPFSYSHVLTQSHFLHCGIYQDLALIAGNPLYGKVVAKVKSQLPPTRIIVFFIGKEKSRVVYKRGNRSGVVYGQRTICSASLVLREKGHSPINPGTYVFPFQICLPSSIPSSMHGTSQNGRSNWKIQYKMHVCAHGNGSRVDKLGERYVTIASAPLPNERVPALILPKSYRVESFGLNKGSLSVGAKVLDAHVGRGVNLEIFLASRNDATVSIHRVQVCLIEEATFSARGRSNSARCIIAELPDVDLPGIVRGKQSPDHVRQHMRGGGSADMEGIYQDLESRANKISMPVPLSSRDSYGGALITVDHFLEITLFTKALVSNPSVRIPIQIGFPPMEQEQPPRHAPVAASAPLPVGLPTLPTPLPPPMSSAPPRARAQPMPQASIPALFDTYEDIPFASAVIIPTDDEAVRAPMASAPLEALVLGGTAAFSEVESSFAPSAPLAPSTRPSLAALLEEMIFSINDFEIMSTKLQDATWASLLANLSPDDFGSVLAHVNMDIDQPRVAELLARQMGSKFRCEHCKVAAQNAAEWNKTTTIQRLLPFCVDITANSDAILGVLSEWERTVTKHAFELEISRRQRG